MVVVLVMDRIHTDGIGWVIGAAIGDHLSHVVDRASIVGKTAGKPMQLGLRRQALQMGDIKTDDVTRSLHIGSVTAETRQGIERLLGGVREQFPCLAATGPQHGIGQVTRKRCIELKCLAVTGHGIWRRAKITRQRTDIGQNPIESRLRIKDPDRLTEQNLLVSRNIGLVLGSVKVGVITQLGMRNIFGRPQRG